MQNGLPAWAVPWAEGRGHGACECLGRPEAVDLWPLEAAWACGVETHFMLRDTAPRDDLPMVSVRVLRR